MSIRKRYILLSSIGFVIPQHPIFEIAAEFPPHSIHLITSDETHPSNKPIEESVESNVEIIKSHFNRISSEIVVNYGNHTRFKMGEFEKNTYEMAKIIIDASNENPELDIVLDLSTGRIPTKMALARAGEIAFDYFDLKGDDEKFRIPSITCAMRPENEMMVRYEIKRSNIPSIDDQIVLDFIKMEGKRSQKGMADALNISHPIKKWNQSVITKSFGRLVEMNYLDNKYQLTPSGKLVQNFLTRVRK